MARTAITLRKFVANSATGLADPTGDNIDQANGMNLALSSTAIPSQAGASMLVFRIHNSTGSTKVATIKAGSTTLDNGNPPAFRATLGDLAVSLVTTAIAWIGPFESSRFEQTDGSINVDFASGMTGDITAFLMPKNTGN